MSSCCPWAIYTADVKESYELPDDAELIAQATLALADDPRVLTQGSVADAFGIAAGLIREDCPMTESRTTEPEQTRTGHEDCPNCGSSIPLPLKNFCGFCRYPLRVDSFERAARVRRENAERIRREGA